MIEITAIVRRYCFFSTLVFTSLVFAGGEHEVGNGGDPLEILIDQARDSAGHMAIDATSTALAGIPAETKEWIVANRYRLASDILNRPHQWLDAAPWQTCARTNVSQGGYNPETLYFVRSLCRSELLDEDMAARLLIHESTHHMGILDEVQANNIANAVYTAWRRSVDLRRPHWESSPTLKDAPTRRGLHTAIWTADTGDASTSQRMIIWGGCHDSATSLVDCGTFLNSGAVFDEEHNTWSAMPTAGAPKARAFHSGIWTGKTRSAATSNRLIVWGGCTGSGDSCSDSLNSGGVYSPKEKKWTTIESESAPVARVFHTAVWANEEMIIWGGLSGYKGPANKYRPLNDGATYNLATHRWTKLPSQNAPLARLEHSAIWTGKNSDDRLENLMIVWGGCDKSTGIRCVNYFNTGAIYDATHKEWRPMSTVNAPQGRRGHTAVWTGSKMIVWGGEGSRSYLNSGAVYDPATDTWEPMSSIAPQARGYHSAVWTGSKMIVWGGMSATGQYPNEFGEYVPDTASRNGNGDRWEVLQLVRTPSGSRLPSAIWTGHSMIVWGGETVNYTFLNSGSTFFSGRPTARANRPLEFE